VVGEIGPRASALRNVRFDRDLQDAKGNSIAWQAGRNWRQLPWQPVTQRKVSPGTLRFVAPYPASLLKLMVAVGVGLALDRGLIADWPAALEPMVVLSDNDATTELVALLHRLNLVDPLNARFAELGLATLQLNDTKANGGWRNADGSGVGHIHMTAWDTVRLLWLLDADAPPAPWLPAGTVLLQATTRDHLRGVLERQQCDNVLSSGSLREIPGWLPGLPDAPAFAHKTGFTDNYASDAGILRTADGTHAIVALLSNLGARYASDPRCATPWRVPALGAALARVCERASKIGG
jgi:beta-lactamase class A